MGNEAGGRHFAVAGVVATALGAFVISRPLERRARAVERSTASRLMASFRTIGAFVGPGTKKRPTQRSDAEVK